MKIRRSILMAGALLFSALLTSQSQAVSVSYNVSADNINTNIFGFSGWDSGAIVLPSGTTIGPNEPLEIHLTLNHTIIAGDGLYFGMGGFDPVVPNNDEAFTFSIYLTLDGNPLPGTYGFPLINPFQDVDNLYVSWDPGFAGVEFNDLHISVTSPVERSVDSFRTGVKLPSSVPDTSSTGMLLGLGSLGMIAFGLRKSKSVA